MTGLHTVDAAVLIGYLLGITALGIWMARRVQNIGDYLMPRRFGKAMMIAHAFGTGTASDQAVSVAAETFRSGLSGIWWQWVWLPATPFYWLIAPIMRRFRAVTTADVYALRYDRSVAVLFAIVGIITVLFVLYGSAGGLGAAIVTDFVQGILTILFSFMLLPCVLHAVGGIEGIRQTIRDPSMLSLVVPGEIGLFFVVAGGIVFAYRVPDVVTALKIWFKIAPMMGIAFWLGLLWRRGTVAGAWATTLSGFGAWWLTTTPTFVGWIARCPLSARLGMIWQEPGAAPEIYEPWTIVFYLTTATLSGITVSLISRPCAKDKLDLFYALTRTPIAPGETSATPCTLPEGAAPPQRRMLITSFGLEVPVPSRTSLLGFVAGWLAVAALIGGFVLLVRA